MKYSIGDVVRFKIGSDEIQKGEIQFIEKSRNENILYINSFSEWAYKVAEGRIVSRVRVKNKFNVKLNKSFKNEGGVFRPKLGGNRVRTKVFNPDDVKHFDRFFTKICGNCRYFMRSGCRFSGYCIRRDSLIYSIHSGED